MEKKDIEYFKKLGRNLMFQLSDEEAQLIMDEFEVLQQQLLLLEAIDTNGVEEMIYPFEEETSFIRCDEVNHTVTQVEALENAKCVKQGHFLVPRVVK